MLNIPDRSALVRGALAVTVVVLGGTETVGSLVLALLAEAGVQARALARGPAERERIEHAGHEAVEGDIDAPATLAAAVQGAERLFLLSPPHPRLPEREKAAIDAARGAGVGHVVALSAMGASRQAPGAFAHWHGEVDEYLAGSGLSYTILRPAGSMQAHLWPVATLAEGRWYGMTGDGASAWIDADDIAASAVAVLTGPGAGRQTLEITGPRAFSMREAAAELAAGLGRQIEFVDLSEAAYGRSLAAEGVPPWLVEGIVAYYQVVRAGHLTTVTDHVERLTGRPGSSYAEFVTAHAGEVSQ